MSIKQQIISLSILTILLFCSCKNETRKSEKILYSVDLNQNSEVSLFDIFSEVEIVNLEISDSAIIKSINKLFVYKNDYYILDYFSSKIFSFTENGIFKFKIDNKGQGPNEYLNISDFELREDSIYLLSSWDGKIHTYNMQGHFVKMRRLPKCAGNYEAIRYLNSDTIAFWTFDYNKRLKFYSKSADKIFKETVAQENDIYSSFSTPVFPFDNLLVNAFDNQVMQMLASGELTLAYEWDFGDLNNDVSKFKKAPDVFDEDSHKKMYEFARKIYASEIVNYFFGMSGGNSQYAYTQIMRKNRNVSVFYEKDTKKSYVFDKTVEGATIFPYFWTEEYVIGIVPEISELSIDDILPDKILDEKNKANKMKISKFDNPILIKYYFKK